MIEKLEAVICALIGPCRAEDPFFDGDRADDTTMARALNDAFLVTLAGTSHPAFQRAKRFLEDMSASSEWADAARFYLEGVRSVHREITHACREDPSFAARLEDLAEWVSHRRKGDDTPKGAERFWSVFFPEAIGILENREACIRALRSKRKVTISKLQPSPITDPAGQLLFTSNVLITIPPPTKPLSDLRLSGDLKHILADAVREPQIYWYDHPIQIGMEDKNNELLYGLRGLEAAFAFERERGNLSGESRPLCVLSVSVTHSGLQGLAKRYIEEALALSGEKRNVDLHAFTEADTRKIISEILAPAARLYLQREDAEECLDVFGVDGAYGRHYSFLKAIAAFWKVFIDPELKGTFKIDMDQVFPQEKLVAETGASAFEHFKTPLWGACGVDSGGRPLDLGMIAGALVNERDIDGSLFTPDIPFPDVDPSCDEFFFFSALPQALSTEAEMMSHPDRDDPDGRRTCLQRIHVTGGTNGILVDSLRRHRPFTPSFMGRAEDQAYLLSVLMGPGTRLAYVHKEGLVMRHDKEAFAQEAIESALVGKLIGDYTRILHFSAYARALTDRVAELKEIIDPFTGCFVSFIPTTVVFLRFAFKVASFFATGEDARGIQFIRNGARRIMQAVDFVRGKENMLKRIYDRERLGWALFYDVLDAVEQALRDKDDFALKLQKKAGMIVKGCAIRTAQDIPKQSPRHFQ